MSTKVDVARAVLGIVGVLLSAASVCLSSNALAPRADHHQHLFSPGIAALISFEPIGVDDLVARLDEAGIKRAVILSVAYMYGSPSRSVEHEYEKVKGENDWTSQQVARFSDRLRGFCSINPLKDYALGEIGRCAKNPHLRYGLKLHFGNSAIDYHNSEHVARIRGVFRAANDHRMAIVVHMRASISRKIPYGRDEAQIFLNEFVAAAPDVPIQIAHLAGAGWGFFGQISLANRSTSPITTFFNFGLGGNGLFTGRPRDELGLAYAYTDVSRVFKDNLDLLPFGGRRLWVEHQVEFFYNLHIAPWLQLTGDLQIIRPNRPIADTAIVPGARLKVVF